MTSVTIADSIAARVRALGVTQVFGIPGTHNLELYRAFAAVGITIIPAHHEQGLGYAADGLARVTGKPAVVLTTTGPGITNLITALATSAAASVPILAIAPGIPSSGLGEGEGWLHDLPSQIDLLSQVVRSRRATTSTEAVRFIDEVAASWTNERPLPAYLEIPFDRLAEPAETVPRGETEGNTERGPLPEDAEDIERAAATLSHASRPVIIAGRGATAKPSVQALQIIAERLGAPVLTTANGKGALNEHHPLAVGVALRVEEGRNLIRAADALLVIGTDLGSSEYWGPPVVGTAPMIRVDADPRGMRANGTPDVALLGRAEVILPALSEALAAALPKERTPWAPDARALVREDLHRLGGEYEAFHAHLERLTGDLDVAVAGDSSQVSYFGTATYWPARTPNRFLYPAGYGTLGYAVPAAIGAQLSGEVDRTIALTGEGALLFSLQELATVARLGLPVTTIVWVNGGFQEIREGMDRAHIARDGVDFPSPDFVQLAGSFGIRGRRVATDGAGDSALGDALEWALGCDGPTLIEVVEFPVAQKG